MSEDLDDLLSGLASAASGATRPRGPEAARQRGKQRTMYKKIAVPVMSVAMVAAAAGIAFAATGNGHGTPGPAAPGHHHTGIASPAPSTTGGTTPGTTPSATPTHHAGAVIAPGVTVTTPGSNTLAAGTLNPVDLTVANNAPARTVTVSLDLGTPRTMNPASFHPTEQAVVQRQDPDGGQWVPVPVTTSNEHDVAAYQLALPAHATTTEHLRVIPVGAATEPIRVAVSGTGFSPATSTLSEPLLIPDVTGTGPTSVSRGATSGVFTFTLTNSTSGSYSGVGVSALTYGSTPDCDAGSLATIQWNDDGAWKAAGATTDVGFAPLETIPLGAHQTARVEVRLVVPASLAGCVAKGGVGVLVSSDPSTPAGEDSSSATAAPTFQSRDDAPLFAVK